MFAATQPRRSLDSFSGAGSSPLCSDLHTGTLPRLISFVCNSCVNCRVCSQNSHSGTHLTPITTALHLFFSTTYALPILQLLYFDGLPSNGGCTPSSTLDSDLQTFQPVSELSPLFSHSCAFSCARAKLNPFFSSDCALFTQNTRGWGDPFAFGFLPALCGVLLLCATLKRWEFCGGFHAGGENRTT